MIPNLSSIPIKKYPALFHCYRSPKNVGLGGARDLGISKAKGKYLMFVDSDDIVSPNYILTAVELVENNNADIAQVGTYYTTNCNSASYLPGIKSHSEKVYSNIEFTTKIHLLDNLSTNKIFLREIIVNNDIQFKKRIWEDTLFVYKYLNATKKIVVTRDQHYYYRLNTDSLSCNLTPSKLRAMISNNDDMLDLFVKLNLDKNYISHTQERQWKGIVRRLDGMNRKQRKEVFSNFDQENGLFSKYIFTRIHQVTSSDPIYRYYRIKILGIKHVSKQYIKKVLRKFSII